MTLGDEALNLLTPTLPWKSDWANVLERAGLPEPRPARRFGARRRRILALAVFVAILIALAAASIWWLFR